MIKSLLEAGERQPEKIAGKQAETAAIDSAVDESFETHFAGIETSPETNETETLPETFEAEDDELIFSEKPDESANSTPLADPTRAVSDFSEPQVNQPVNLFAESAASYEPIAETTDEPANDEPLAGFPVDEMNFELPAQAEIQKTGIESADISNEATAFQTPVETARESVNHESPFGTPTEKPNIENGDMLFYPQPAERESFAETARNSGLAYAAAITLFGSVVFMLIIGWFADLLLGSSPWGIVGGILLGAAIGFFQFFRLTAQIFRDKNQM